MLFRSGKGVGTIRLANGGKLTFNNITVKDLSVSYAENSWEFGYLEFAGNLEFNACTFINAVMMESEHAVFTNCSFNSNDDNQYGVWVDNGNAEFNNCTFSGARGLKAHEAYGSEVKSIVVDNCTFNQLTKKPGIALGDFNSETAVEIKNSIFDRCQAGDQKNYMYESDTDINSFTFVATNNLVIPSGDSYLVQEDGSYVTASVNGLKAAIDAIENEGTIRLANGEYDGLFHVGGKNITLTALNTKQATVKGRISVAGDANTTFTCENLKLAVSENTNGAFGNTYYDKGIGYIIGIYCGNVVVDNCDFSGMTDDFGAINYHNYNSGATTDNLEKLTVTNCKFDGYRAIRSRSNVSVIGCQFTGLETAGLQVLGLGDSTVESTVEFVNNTSDVITSGVCIKTSNFVTKNITFKVAGNTNCNFIAFDKKNINNLYLDTYKYTGEVNTLNPEDTDALNSLLANTSVTEVVLLPVKYEGTIVMKSGVTINGQNNATVDCINLNGADNVTIKDIQFDAAGAQSSYDGSGKAKQYANIISGGADKPLKGSHNLVIDGCIFKGTFANGGAAIAFTDQSRISGFSGNITIQNCIFNTVGAYYDIYTYYSGDGTNGYGDFKILNNRFKSFTQRKPVYLGKYASSTPVEVKGNTFETKASLEAAVYLQDHSSYGVSVNAENNTFAE